jgi:hypothetical protein
MFLIYIIVAEVVEQIQNDGSTNWTHIFSREILMTNYFSAPLSYFLSRFLNINKSDDDDLKWSKSF